MIFFQRNKVVHYDPANIRNCIITAATIYGKTILPAKAKLHVHKDGIRNAFHWMLDRVRHDIVSFELPRP